MSDVRSTIVISKDKRLILNVPYFKRNGYVDRTEVYITSSPGLVVTYGPSIIDGPGDDYLIVYVDVLPEAANGDNWIQISGSPAPLEIKRFYFTVSDSPAYWEFGQWREG
jgi:hypothetical protein